VEKAVRHLDTIAEWCCKCELLSADGTIHGTSLRRVGKIWHLRYQNEEAEFPVRGNKFLGWLAKLLSKPDHGWTVAELLGDPDGKLKADTFLGGERTANPEALEAIWKRMQDIDTTIEELGGCEALEDERNELLKQVEACSAKEPMRTGVGKAYHNITTQKRQFLKELKPHMPQLTAHLQASIDPSARDYTITYRPPKGTPKWHVENPTG
jgi:hypothetical protein